MAGISSLYICGLAFFGALSTFQPTIAQYCPDHELFPTPVVLFGSGSRQLEIADVNSDGLPDLIASGGVIALGDSDRLFGPSQQIETGSESQHVATGDLNGDGVVDIASSSVQGREVIILLGNGDGTFAERTRLPMPIYTTSSVICELNGDVSPDLIVTTSNGVMTAFGVGDGTFDMQDTPVFVTSNPSVTCCDVDGDGDTDILTTNRSDGDIAVILNSGDGMFGQPMRFDTSRGPFALRCLHANEDESIDVAVLCVTDDVVQVFAGDESGAMTSLGTFDVASFAAMMEAADFDADGTTDLIVGSEVFQGMGDGTFESRFTFGADQDFDDVAVADVNGDAVSDVLLSGNYGVFVAQSLGLFKFDFHQQLDTSYDPSTATFADFDRDGIDDLIVAGVSNRAITVHRRDSNGAFTAPAIVYDEGRRISAMGAADLDGDRWNDLVVLDDDDRVLRVLKNIQGLDLLIIEEIELNWDSYELIVADFNGDGMADVLLGGAPIHSGVSVFLGNGDGTLQSPIAQLKSVQAHHIVVADFNDDSVIDLAVGDGHNAVMVIAIGLGDGRFDKRVLFPTANGWAWLAVGDVDNDFDIDVVYMVPNGMNTLINGGSGSFELVTGQSSRSEVANTIISLGDVTGDGIIDLIRGTNSVDIIGFHEGNGDGTFGESHWFAGVSRPEHIIAVDLNHDSALDILAVNVGNPSGKGGISVLYNRCGFRCTADLDSDVVVGASDVQIVLDNWSTNRAGADIAEPISTVDIFDLLGMLRDWGECE